LAGSHFSKEVAGGALAVAMLASVAAIFFVSDVRIVATERVGQRMRILWQDIYSMVRSVIPLFTIVLVCSPIGAGAMNNLWSAVASDWSTGPDTVALVTGILNGVISALGCMIGGWIADRVGRWWSYFGSGIAIGSLPWSWRWCRGHQAASQAVSLFMPFFAGWPTPPSPR
jgi:PAT family beta-lactamase induction signal transducer AmpG